jgi:hypothetical protein
MKIERVLRCSLALCLALSAQSATANELGGVNFDWTHFSNDGPYKGRFTNHNSTCKMVQWMATSYDGQTIISPSGNMRMDSNSTTDVQISDEVGSAAVVIQAVRDC